MAKRVSIINFKGGVGKTTLAFHLGTGLALLDAKVLLVDMDHQSSLSILCLNQTGWQKAVASQRTVSEIFRSFAGDRPELPNREIILKSPLTRLGVNRDQYRNIDIVASELQLDNVEIALTASHQGNAIRSEWNKRTLMCRWIEESGIDDDYDYIIFDCPPATKIVSQNAIAASHGYIIPVIPEAVMQRGTPHLVGMMETDIDDELKGYALSRVTETRQMYVSDTKLVGLVITRIQTARGGYTIDHRQQLTLLERRWGDLLVKPYIPQGIGISEALTAGVPVYNRWRTQNVGGRDIHRRYRELTDEMKKRIDA